MIGLGNSKCKKTIIDENIIIYLEERTKTKTIQFYTHILTCWWTIEYQKSILQSLLTINAIKQSHDVKSHIFLQYFKLFF